MNTTGFLIALLCLSSCQVLAQSVSPRKVVAQPCINAVSEYCVKLEAQGCDNFYITLMRDGHTLGEERHVALKHGPTQDNCIDVANGCRGCTNLATFEEANGLGLCLRTNIDCGPIQLNYENCTTLPDCSKLDCSETACKGHGTCDTSHIPPRCNCNTEGNVKYSGLTCAIGTYETASGASCITAPFTEDKPLCATLDVENCKSLYAELTYKEYHFGPLNFDLEQLENNPASVKPQCTKIGFLDDCQVCVLPRSVSIQDGKLSYCSSMTFNCYGFVVPSIDMGCVTRDVVKDCHDVSGSCPGGCGAHGDCKNGKCWCGGNYYGDNCNVFNDKSCVRLLDSSAPNSCLKFDTKADCDTRQVTTSVTYGSQELINKVADMDSYESALTSGAVPSLGDDCTLIASVLKGEKSNTYCPTASIYCPDDTYKVKFDCVEATGNCPSTSSGIVGHVFWAIAVLLPLALIGVFGFLAFRWYKNKQDNENAGFTRVAIHSDGESGSDEGLAPL